MSQNAIASSSRTSVPTDASHRKEKSKNRDHKDHKGKRSKSHTYDHEQKHYHKDRLNQSSGSPFEYRQCQMRLSVPPKYSADWLVGVRETLDGMLMRYVPQMGGVLLAHWEHEFLDDTVQIINECPFGVCEIQFHSIIWAPQIGQVLTGTHSLSSPSHISLLFAKTFNVSIPLQHIPLDRYEFEHDEDAAEENASFHDSEEEDEDDGDFGPGLGGGAVHEVGRWKEKGTGKLIGENNQQIKFTVIGIQVNNQMLSLIGSLLPDPSNPPPMPEPAISLPTRRSPSPELMDVDIRPSKSRKLNASTKLNTNKNLPKPTNNYSTSSVAPVVNPVGTFVPVEMPEGLSAREQKKWRKEDEKRKRDERKARKAGRDNDKEGQGEDVTGGKRKAQGHDHLESKKKKK